MFSDLVGSTALSARMDPEDLREIISAYQKCVAETVQRFGGFVAKYMGDGVLIYFGYPQAREDDAERSVRAGLELIQAVAGLKSSAPLQTRVGIATGLVVVGDLIGSGEARERSIVGETPNVAARLQGIAQPNTVVIAESTRKLLGNLFDLQELGAQGLKGIDSPVRAWTALRSASIESRFEALRASRLTELVGREEELELLLRRWSKADGGEGQVVLLSGEAGIGKSRLTAAFMERLAGEPHTRLRYFCSPQHTDSALHPITGQMERAAAFAHDDALKAKLDKLDRVLAQTSTSKQDATLFADMLSLPNDGRYPTLDFTPQQRRQRTLQALVSQMEALSVQNPVLMIFEFAHWTDPTSLEVFGRIVDRIATLRALLLVTFRPEFEPSWIGPPHVTALTLSRLSKRDIGAIIDGIVGNELLPAGIRQDIIERTDGIPLFIEEMTKAVVEAENEGEARRTASAISAPAQAVPPSLHASLMARLDRLGPAKEIAQIGAAIGREFAHPLLAVVARKPEAELVLTLDSLIQSGLLFRQGFPPHATYLFKHALVRDAAYGTLLREPRRALHTRIAETIESQFAEIVDSQPELLAHHYTEAGLFEEAANMWGKAGQRSLERSASVEAMTNLTRALELADLLPTTPALRRNQISWQVAHITALMHVKGFAAAETKASVDKARSIIERSQAMGEPENPQLIFSVLFGIWAESFMHFDGTACRELAADFLALAEKDGANVPRMIGHRLLGVSLETLGEGTEGLKHYEQAISLYDQMPHRPPPSLYASDTKVFSLSHRALAFWELGYPKAAIANVEFALKHAREVGHAATLMNALGLGSDTYFLSGDYATANRLLDELVALADEKSANFWKTYATVVRGHILARTGKFTEAVQMITSSIAAFEGARVTIRLAQDKGCLATAYAELGQLDDAKRFIDEAMTMGKTTRYETEINRWAGEITLRSPKRGAAKAETYFERALAVARKQQAKSQELLAAMSMARLWRDQGKREEARELLAPVYGWFTEGFDTLDLKEAKALLHELSATDV
jgi:class 3 adenylate cyclase/predicted ATPase